MDKQHLAGSVLIPRGWRSIPPLLTSNSWMRWLAGSLVGAREATASSLNLLTCQFPICPKGHYSWSSGTSCARFPTVLGFAALGLDLSSISH